MLESFTSESQLSFLNSNGDIVEENINTLQNEGTNITNSQVETTKKSINNCLLLENKLVYKDSKSEVFFDKIEEDKDMLYINIFVNLGLEKYKIKLITHKLKKYIYPVYIGNTAKNLSGVKIILLLNSHLDEIIKSSNIELNVQDYHFSQNKPRDIIEKEVQKNPEANFTNTVFEINGNNTNILFNLNGYNFRVTKINTSSVKQRNGGADDENEIINFNKICLDNIGIFLDNGDNKSGWKRFTSSFQFYEFYRSEISKFIFNELNSYRYKEALEKAL